MIRSQRASWALISSDFSERGTLGLLLEAVLSPFQHMWTKIERTASEQGHTGQDKEIRDLHPFSTRGKKRKNTLGTDISATKVFKQNPFRQKFLNDSRLQQMCQLCISRVYPQRKISISDIPVRLGRGEDSEASFCCCRAASPAHANSRSLFFFEVFVAPLPTRPIQKFGDSPCIGSKTDP